MRVIAVHLLNDFSGSPKVLRQLLNGWAKRNVELHLFTCSGREGFLSDLPSVICHFYWYKFAKNPLIRLIFLFSSQILLAVKLVFFLNKDDVLYINTVLPFGAALAGKIRGVKVIYHIHETSMKPLLFKRFLFGIVRCSADDIVYVSEFLANQEPLDVRKHIIHNVLEEEFIQKTSVSSNYSKHEKIVLMICSLKAYKGVNEFLKLAEMNSGYVFKLIVNASISEINDYFKNVEIPVNLLIYPTQINTHQFYDEAAMVLNLSDTKLWVETFGLTILEAMAYGLPTIVPPVGGVTELVDEGRNGFLIDSKNLSLLSATICRVLEDKELYNEMSKHAKDKSRDFNLDIFEQKSFNLLS
ncbi:glycosyltransferase family 4 protein [Flavobacterium sp. AG291]|uniref:glycosyltransferase family 4 protein n=1 Tax=Flavobacterium sp. AG291 TaxID=2184000 RepID=UPI000E0B4673|nr:glycosyltransferase family 4 protein [Flavobacterium sp. AG291]RDI10348.1 glycosyltransferase involved in cell wall biosynthesis [Flavobacterium sp. AG291]